MPKKKNNFLIFISFVLFISFGLAFFSIKLYYKSGSYSVDLSRPDYKKIRTKINRNQDHQISNTGDIEQEFIDQVNQKIEKYKITVSAEDVFNDDAMSDHSLGINVAE